MDTNKRQLRRANDVAILQVEHDVRQEVARGEDEEVYGSIASAIEREAGRIVSYRIASEKKTLIRT